MDSGRQVTAPARRLRCRRGRRSPRRSRRGSHATGPPGIRAQPVDDLACRVRGRGRPSRGTGSGRTAVRLGGASAASSARACWMATSRPDDDPDEQEEDAGRATSRGSATATLNRGLGEEEVVDEEGQRTRSRPPGWCRRAPRRDDGDEVDRRGVLDAEASPSRTAITSGGEEHEPAAIGRRVR